MKHKNRLRLAVLAVTILLTCVFAAPTLTRAFAQGLNAAGDESTLPASYCMRDEYLIFTQNQDKHGYCWDFAATMSAQTTIMKATGEYYDFSELWTGVSLYTHGDYKKMGAGGSMSYHANAINKAGLMLECDLPYQYSYPMANENAIDYYNFFEHNANDDLASCLVYDKTTSFKQTDVEAIKTHLLNHGSLYLAFSFRTGYVDSDKDGVITSYLPPNQNDPNSAHAVSIIGWDDNYEREVIVDGETEPRKFKGAWLLLNSYTEKSGIDGLSFIFYDDENIDQIAGYKYQKDTQKDLYFYDKIESGYAYPNPVIGKYHGDFTAKKGTSKQKNVFYDDVNLTYSYDISSGAEVKDISIYLDGRDVTSAFTVTLDKQNKRFSIAKDDADYGQHKVVITYGNGTREDVYLNNFFVTHGLVGEEIEYNHELSPFTFLPGRDLEFYSYISPKKDYVVYTDSLSGSIGFYQTEQSIYSEKNMSIPKLCYEITNGAYTTVTHTITAETGYNLNYNFNVEYVEDTTLQPVTVYYDLGGGENHPKNYYKELASPTTPLKLYAPTREGYTFKGWYLDYSGGSKKLDTVDGVYIAEWDDICHLGEEPTLNAIGYYKEFYSNTNTLFLYAHWEEIDYYTVDLTVEGDGKTQIDGTIEICADDTVRYLLQPTNGWCVEEVIINGAKLDHKELVDAIKNGIIVKNIQENLSIKVTFKEGVLLSLDLGKNVKNAYILGVIDGQIKKFYNGDYIPASYFDNDIFIRPLSDTNGKFNNYLVNNNLVFIKNDVDFERKDLDFIKDDVEIDDEEKEIICEAVFDDGSITLKPGISLPTFGTQFTLVVEVEADNAGNTYVLDDVGNYNAVSKGVFSKTVKIESGAVLYELEIADAQPKPIQSVTLTYTVGDPLLRDEYILDHYISADPNATSGAKFTATFEAGQVAYVFVKKKADTQTYYYKLPSIFTSIGGDWYRAPVYVNAAEPNLGNIRCERELQRYRVTWLNWDGSVIYSEMYSYGKTPAYYYRQSQTPSVPMRPDDDEFSYVFTSWDKAIEPVTQDVTYVAQYNSYYKRYPVTIVKSENGTITPDGEVFMDKLDKTTYTFTPNPGYRVSDVKINGVSVGAVSSYTFEGVTAPQTIEATFEKITYFITTAKTGNGTISPSIGLLFGGNATVYFDADIGYKVKDVLIDGVSIGAVDSYTFVNVSADHTVTVVYARDNVMIGVCIFAAVLMLAVVVLSIALVVKKSAD